MYVYTLKQVIRVYPESTALESMHGVVVQQLNGLDDKAAAQMIATNQLDILIEMNGFTEGGRPELVSMLRGGTLSTVSYLGWPSTFGDTRLMQFAMVDRCVVPLESAPKYFTEKLIILPRSFFVGDHDYKMRTRTTDTASYTTQRLDHRHALGKHEDAFIFCNFNQLFKLSVDKEDTLGLWSQILHRAPPSSILWLLRHPSVAEPFVVRRLLALGINTTTRLSFSDFAEKKQYLARSSAGDLFLDNFRYNAGATGVDALYSGVPVLTMPTDRSVGRFGWSQQNSMRVQTVAWSLKTYENMAVNLSRRPRLVKGIRWRLRHRRKNDLFDMTGFAKDFASVLKMSNEMARRPVEDPDVKRKRMHVVHAK